MIEFIGLIISAVILVIIVVLIFISIALLERDRNPNYSVRKRGRKPW